MSDVDSTGLNWVSLSQAERDAAYDNRAAVADAQELNQRRIEASAACRGDGRLNLPYGPGPRQQWDLFPAARRDAPCLVFVHGGYWQMNRREDFSILVDGARTLGWAAALPGYRLAPEAPIGDIVGDIRRALDWLQAEGPTRGIAGPIILSGWSAGGHLVAMALDHPAVFAGLAISGIFDLSRVRDTYLNDKLALTEIDIERYSPLRLPIVDKPLAVAYGTAELPALVAESRDFFAYRGGATAITTLVPVDGANHFTILDALQSPSGILLRQAVQFADRA